MTDQPSNRPIFDRADRDLLIRMDEKLNLLFTERAEFQRRIEADKQEVWRAIDELTKNVSGIQTVIANAKGMAVGARWLYALIGSLPPGVVALIFGIKSI